MQTPEVATAAAPFGRVLSAMITPFTADGGLDLDGAQKLADHLVSNGHDGLVLNGTTGESPTTSDAEKAELVRAVVDAVGDRAVVVAGAGSNETRHSVELAKQAAAAGAHGLLLVTPYYNRPPQAGLIAHFTAVADATELPMMLYDIPARTGREIEFETLLRLAEHPRIVANKDAKGDLNEASAVMARTDLAYYSGDDALNLAMLALGGVGIVSVVAHVVGPQLRAMVDAFVAGDLETARAIDRSLLPVYEGLFRTQGAILTKAALAQLGLPAGPVRLPLVDATEAELAQLILDLADGGVDGFALPGRDS
jgi:4-hydroxy-tetrahydrodipicolinate synthase